METQFMGIHQAFGFFFLKANKVMAADRLEAYAAFEKELGIFCQTQQIDIRYNPVYASHTGEIF